MRSSFLPTAIRNSFTDVSYSMPMSMPKAVRVHPQSLHRFPPPQFHHLLYNKMTKLKRKHTPQSELPSSPGNFYNLSSSPPLASTLSAFTPARAPSSALTRIITNLSWSLAGRPHDAGLSLRRGAMEALIAVSSLDCSYGALHDQKRGE